MGGKENKQQKLPGMPTKKFADISDKNAKKIQYLTEKTIRGKDYVIVGNRPVSFKTIENLSKVHGRKIVLQIIDEQSKKKFRTSSDALLCLVNELTQYQQYRKWKNRG